MKDKYLIHISGNIVVDGDIEKTDLTTTGSFYKKDNKYYICYQESQATGFEGSSTTIKIGDAGASIIRYGKHPNILMIQKGVTNICNYDTVAGRLVLDINGIDISHNLLDNGGYAQIKYTLNSSGLLISENSINIKVKEL